MSLQQYAEAIRQMLETDGWRIVHAYIEDKLTYHKGQLLHCTLEEVMKHRNMIEAYKSITVHLEGIINESIAE